jgi:hypothetical protein
MADNNVIQKSLVEQIYDELITRLDNKEGFDEELIQKIKDLSNSDELKKPAKLQSVLKP